MCEHFIWRSFDVKVAQLWRSSGRNAMRNSLDGRIA